MIFISVGTFVKGFDELINAVDFACKKYGFQAFAQIGNSAVIPKHINYTRFLSVNDMQQQMRNATLIVCHGGFGILGDAMRAGKPIIAVPRQHLANTAEIPINNQRNVVLRLREVYGILVCLDVQDLPEMINATLSQPAERQAYNLHCNIPKLIANFLSR